MAELPTAGGLVGTALQVLCEPLINMYSSADDSSLLMYHAERPPASS
jgi:hypothetical protein